MSRTRDRTFNQPWIQQRSGAIEGKQGRSPSHRANDCLCSVKLAHDFWDASFTSSHLKPFVEGNGVWSMSWIPACKAGDTDGWWLIFWLPKGHHIYGLFNGQMWIWWLTLTPPILRGVQNGMHALHGTDCVIASWSILMESSGSDLWCMVLMHAALCTCLCMLSCSPNDQCMSCSAEASMSCLDVPPRGLIYDHWSILFDPVSKGSALMLSLIRFAFPHVASHVYLLSFFVICHQYIMTINNLAYYSCMYV